MKVEKSTNSLRDEALEKALEVFQSNPKNRDAALNLGLILVAKEDFRKAVEVYRASLAHNSKDADIWHNLGHALLKLGYTEEARRSILKATKYNPRNAISWSKLGETYMHGYDFDVKRAEQAFQRAVQEDPEYTVAWHNLGVTLVFQDRMEEAHEAFERALLSNPDKADMAETYYWMSIIYGARPFTVKGLPSPGKVDRMKVEEYLRKSVEIDPHHKDAAFALHRFYLWSKDDKEKRDAIAVLENWVESNPSDLDGVRELVELQIRLRNLKELQDTIKKASESTDDTYPLWLNYGALLVKHRLYQEAQLALENATRIDPARFEAWANLSLALTKLGHCDEAKMAIDTAEKLESGNPHVIKALGIWMKECLREDSRYEAVQQMTASLSIEHGQFICEGCKRRVDMMVRGIAGFLCMTCTNDALSRLADKHSIN